MKDERRTKKQLTNELAELRHRVAELEASEAGHKRAEEALSESEERYRHIFEQSPIGIGIASLDGKVVTANKAMQAMTGYSLEELKKIGVVDIYENIEDREALLEAITRDGGVVDFPVRKKRRDGTPYDALLSISRIDLGGRVFLHTICQDITERKQAEKALRESEERFRRLSEAAFEAIAVHQEGIIVDAGQTAVAMFGYELPEVIGMQALDFVTPESRDLVLKNILSEHEEPYEAIGLRKDGSTFVGEFRGKAIPYQGRTARVVAIRDITKRKEAEEALRRRAEELAALQATVLEITTLHDLPTLLQTIVERAVMLLNALSGGLYLCDPVQEEARCVVSYNTPDDYTGTVLKYGEGAAGTVAETGEPLIIDDYRTWNGRSAIYEKEQPFTTVLSAPMIWRGQLTGVIHVLHNVESRRFTQADLELLTLFANHAAIAVENARLYEAAQQELAERKRVEEDIRRLKEFNEGIVQGMAEALLIEDATGIITFVNPALEALLGYTADELVGRHWHTIVPEEEVKQVRQKTSRRPDGISEQYETRLLAADSTEIPVIVSARPLFEGETFTGILSAFTDISKRKRAEETLQESERKFRCIVEQSSDGIVLADEQGAIIEWNLGMERTTGLKRAETLGQPLWDVQFQLPPDEQKTSAAYEQSKATALEVLRKGQSPQLNGLWEAVIQCPDGTRRVVQESVFPIQTNKGFMIGGIVRDITERKQAEELLQAAARQWRTTFDAISDPVCLLDLEGRILRCNIAMTRLLEKPFSEVIGRTCWEVVHGTSEPIEGCPTVRISETHRRATQVLPIGDRWFNISADPLLDASGNLIGTVHIMADITERKQAEDELRSAHRKLQTVFDAIQENMSVIDFDFNIRDVNSVLIKTFGLPAKESIIGRKCFEVLKGRKDICPYCPVAEVYRTKAPVYRTSSPEEVLLLGGRSFEVFAYPVMDEHGNPVGVVEFARDMTKRKQAEEELRQSYVQLQRTLEGTVNTLVSAIEMRDPYTAGHQRQVTQLAYAIAKEMGLPEERIEGIRMAGLIHDLGKINVPAEILSKPGPLTELEYGLIQMHPQIGHDVLKTIDFPWPVAQTVLQHHERMDSSGYPQGLSGEEILLEARILGVADVVEAMASHRPYRPPRGMDKALQEISQNRGILYDPEVVDACLRLFIEKGFTFE